MACKYRKNHVGASMYICSEHTDRCALVFDMNDGSFQLISVLIVCIARCQT